MNMGNINAVVTYETADAGRIAIIAMDNPPVNALGHALRSGLVAAIEKARGDGAAHSEVCGQMGWGYFG